MAYELFIDGFDHYGTSGLVKKWYSNSISTSIQSGAGRRSTSAVYLESEAFPGVNLASRIFSDSTHCVIGMAIKPIGGRLLIYMQGDAGQTHCVFGIDASTGSVFAINSAGAEVARSDNGLTLNAYSYFELGVFSNNSGTLEARINGTSVGWIPSTSTDTYISGSNIRRIAFLGVGYIDDVYIAYGDELKWLGDSRVDALPLTADSSPQDWTPDTGNAWERLNADEGYILSDTIGDASMFAVANISHNPSTIHGVQLSGLVNKSDAGYRSAALLIKSGATTTEGDSLALATDPWLIRQPYILNPTTSAAWSISDVDGIEIGVKVTG